MWIELKLRLRLGLLHLDGDAFQHGRRRRAHIGGLRGALVRAVGRRRSVAAAPRAPTRPLRVWGVSSERCHTWLSAGASSARPRPSTLLVQQLVVPQQRHVHQSGVGGVEDGPVLPPARPAKQPQDNTNRNEHKKHGH
jgi:hypothetical protein